MSNPHVYTHQDFENSVHYWKELCGLHEAESKRLEQDLARTRGQLAGYESDFRKLKNEYGERFVELTTLKQQLSTAENELEQEIAKGDKCSLDWHFKCEEVEKDRDLWAHKAALYKLDLAKAEKKLTIAREALEKIEDALPENQSGYACNFCDMGDAGYAYRGKGWHDDKCPYWEVSEALKKLAEHTQLNTPMPMGEEKK